MLKVGDKARIKKPNLEVKDEFLEPQVVDILKDCKFIGEVSQIQEGLFYLSFKNDQGWVTQVFKADEIEEVK